MGSQSSGTTLAKCGSRLNLSNADGRVRVYRRRHERYANNCVQEYDRFGCGGVMVCAAINHGFRFQLVAIQGLTAREYINQILRPVILPMFRQRRGLVLQQDNARPHVAHIARTTLTFSHGQQFLQSNMLGIILDDVYGDASHSPETCRN